MKLLFTHRGGLIPLMLFLLLGASGMTRVFAQTQVGSQFYNNGFVYEVTQMSPECVKLVGFDQDNLPTGTLTLGAPVSWDDRYWKGKHSVNPVLPY